MINSLLSYSCFYELMIKRFCSPELSEAIWERKFDKQFTCKFPACTIASCSIWKSDREELNYQRFRPAETKLGRRTLPARIRKEHFVPSRGNTSARAHSMLYTVCFVPNQGERGSIQHPVNIITSKALKRKKSI